MESSVDEPESDGFAVGGSVGDWLLDGVDVGAELGDAEDVGMLLV